MFSFSNNTRIPDASPKYYFSLTSVSVGVLFILRAQMPRTVYLKANIRVETCEKQLIERDAMNDWLSSELMQNQKIQMWFCQNDRYCIIVYPHFDVEKFSDSKRPKQYTNYNKLYMYPKILNLFKKYIIFEAPNFRKFIE